MSPTDAPRSPRSISETRSACSIRINVASPPPAVGVLISAEVRAARAPLVIMSATSATRVSNRDNRGIVILRVQRERPRASAETCILHGRVHMQESPEGWLRSGRTHLIARRNRVLTHNVGAADPAVALPVVDRSLAGSPPDLERWEFGTSDAVRDLHL